MSKAAVLQLLARVEALASSPTVDPQLVAELAQILRSGGQGLRKQIADLVADLERQAAAAALATDSGPAGPSRAELLAIARRGPSARAELPTLLKILDGDDDELRSLAAESLGAVAPGSEELLPRLLSALLEQTSLDPRARRYARAVAALRPATTPELLLNRLEAGGSIERALAVTALCVLFLDSPQPAALPQLLRAARDPELGEARAYAVAALGALGGSSEVVAPLAELLRDRDVRVSREAAVALARCGADGAALLARACEKKTRPPALRKLGWVLDDPPHTLPLLTLLLGDAGPKLANAATRTRIKRYIGQRSRTPTVLLQQLVRDKDRDTKVALALNKAAPPDVLAALAKDRSDEIRRLVADNHATPAEVLVALASDKSDDVKRTLAENPNTPAAALEQLLKAKIPKIKRHVARHRNTPLARLEALAADKDSLVRCAVAGNPNLPYPLLEQLSRDKSLELSVAVAMHPHTPAPVLDDLTRHRDRDVRAAAAANPNLPVARLCELVHDKSADIRRGVAENPSTPPAALTALAGAGLARIDEALLANPRTPAAALAILAARSDASTRLDVLAHDNLPDDVLARLANDEDARVRATALLRMDPRLPTWTRIESSWAEFGDSDE